MVIAIDKYFLKCEACGLFRTKLEFNLGMTYLWSNQHGCKVRLFCHSCGAVHDVTIIPNKTPLVTRQNWQCSVPRKSYEV